jgi:hypothetical protein
MLRASLVSRSPLTAKKSTTRTCSLGMLTRTGEIPPSRRSTSRNLMLYNQSPTVWHSKMQKTTALSEAGQSTTQHRRPAVTRYISASYWSSSALPNSLRHQYTRTTRHASNGKTTLSVVGSAPSTLTFESTSPTKSSRMVKCGLFGFRHHLSWRIFSRRA